MEQVVTINRAEAREIDEAAPLLTFFVDLRGLGDCRWFVGGPEKMCCEWREESERLNRGRERIMSEPKIRIFLLQPADLPAVVIFRAPAGSVSEEFMNL